MTLTKQTPPLQKYAVVVRHFLPDKPNYADRYQRFVHATSEAEAVRICKASFEASLLFRIQGEVIDVSATLAGTEVTL